MEARDLVSTDPVVVSLDTPVAASADLLATRGVSAVPVVDSSGAAVGIVAGGDLIRRLAREQVGPLGWFFGLFRDPSRLADRLATARDATARDVMTPDPGAVGARWATRPRGDAPGTRRPVPRGSHPAIQGRRCPHTAPVRRPVPP